MVSWSARAFEASRAIYDKIISHPFNVEMALGTLSKERFQRYIEQDTIYIANYAEEMHLLAQMLPTGAEQQLFSDFAREGMEAEKSLHELVAEQAGEAHEVTPSAVTTAYIAHTRQFIDTEQLALSMAAILPCIWVYNMVGESIYQRSTLQENPYKEWIMTYSSELMHEGVELSIAITDRLAAEQSPEMQQLMIEAFVRSVELELEFWSDAYNKL